MKKSFGELIFAFTKDIDPIGMVFFEIPTEYPESKLKNSELLRETPSKKRIIAVG